MRSNKGLRGLITAMFSGMTFSRSFIAEESKYTRKDFTPEEEFQRQEDRELSKGLKKFYYGDKYVIALNQYNADRKAKNLGLI